MDDNRFLEYFQQALPVDPEKMSEPDRQNLDLRQIATAVYQRLRASADDHTEPLNRDDERLETIGDLSRESDIRAALSEAGDACGEAVRRCIDYAVAQVLDGMPGLAQSSRVVDLGKVSRLIAADIQNALAPLRDFPGVDNGASPLGEQILSMQPDGLHPSILNALEFLAGDDAGDITIFSPEKDGTSWAQGMPAIIQERFKALDVTALLDDPAEAYAQMRVLIDRVRMVSVLVQGMLAAKKPAEDSLAALVSSTFDPHSLDILDELEALLQNAADRLKSEPDFTIERTAGVATGIQSIRKSMEADDDKTNSAYLAERCRDLTNIALSDVQKMLGVEMWADKNSSGQRMIENMAPAGKSLFKKGKITSPDASLEAIILAAFAIPADEKIPDPVMRILSNIETAHKSFKKINPSV